MARTTGRSGFKMRSGNASTFKTMGSSPMMKERETAISAYMAGTKAMQEARNAGATDAELRDMVVAHNARVAKTKYKGGSAKAKISYARVKSYKPQVKEEPVEETVVLPTPREKEEVVPGTPGSYKRDAGFLVE